jgi:hypothetical protein
MDSETVLTEVERTALRSMELFAACINSGVYDIHIFKRISRTWFVQQYKQVEPYIASRKNPHAYSDLKKLYRKMPPVLNRMPSRLP